MELDLANGSRLALDHVKRSKSRMTTMKILLVAGSAALLANFALAQQSSSQPDPSAPGPVTEQQQQPQPPPAPAPPPPNGSWRRFSGPQQAGNETPNTPPPYNPQGGPPPQGPNNQYPPPMPMALPPASMILPAGTWVKV